MDELSAITQNVLAASGRSDQPSDAGKLRDVTSQFEALLLSQMLHEMRISALDDGTEEATALSPLSDTLYSELGLALSRAGGFGLGETLARAIAKREATPSASVPSEAAGPVPSVVEGSVPSKVEGPAPSVGGGPAPSVVEGPLLDSPAPAFAPAGRISSGFGWRHDPFSRQVRFHNGADVPMPYGHEVEAAGDGRVSFVGEQTGYGLTVLVAHASGVATRYAHLSSAAVRVGDAVARGQVIANSGNTGRSTGPHLHFEVLEAGQPVDPTGPAAAGLTIPG